MAIPVREITEWLEGLDEDQLVGVDEDGLTLQAVEDPDIYLEVGGIPEDGE